MAVQWIPAKICFQFVAQAVPPFVLPEVFSGVVDRVYTITVAASILITIGVGETLLSGAEKRMTRMKAEAPSQ